MEKVKRPPGRPKGTGKPETRFVKWMVRFPPDLLAELQAAMPEGDRAEFVRQAVREKLARRGVQD